MSVDGIEDLVAVAALGDHLEAVVGSEDAGNTCSHDRLVVDDDRADHGDTSRRTSTRHPSSVGPASN